MKRPLIRLVGGVVIGSVMAALYILGPLGAEDGFSFLNRFSGTLGTNGFLQGLMLGLIILLVGGLIGRRTQDSNRASVMVSTVDSYRQRRMHRLQRTRLQRFHERR